MVRARFPLLFPLLIAVSAGLGALSPSFSSDPLPPAFNQEPPAVEKNDPPSQDDGSVSVLPA